MDNRSFEAAARIKALEGALKVFADLAKHFGMSKDEGWLWRGEEPLEITVGDLRRAAHTINGEE